MFVRVGVKLGVMDGVVVLVGVGVKVGVCVGGTQYKPHSLIGVGGLNPPDPKNVGINLEQT